MLVVMLAKLFNNGRLANGINITFNKEIAKTLKVGDIIYLTGFVYTCRDGP